MDIAKQIMDISSANVIQDSQWWNNRRVQNAMATPDYPIHANRFLAAAPGWDPQSFPYFSISFMR